MGAESSFETFLIYQITALQLRRIYSYFYSAKAFGKIRNLVNKAPNIFMMTLRISFL
jgi:hypothetical protein